MFVAYRHGDPNFCPRRVDVYSSWQIKKGDVALSWVLIGGSGDVSFEVNLFWLPTYEHGAILSHSICDISFLYSFGFVHPKTI